MRKQERAFLVGLVPDSRKKWEARESFEELRSLAHTAGALEAGFTLAEIRQVSPATLIGRGKVEELKRRIADVDANLVIIDGNLSPSQNRNLEEAFDVRVIDRTSLILDIFALHAKSREGKLQVQLAQYEYLYPRLVGAWSHFSRQRGGGVGLRGPGETQLEVDRRQIRDRIATLRLALKKVESSRSIHRQKRKSVPLPVVTLVGYTNAGKSTLFNALTGLEQLAEDKLFATLDPKTKKIKLPSGRAVLVTDTVGFIRNLPHQLVEAFKSTFEEARQSDLLLHVVDGSHPNCRQQIDVVDEVMRELLLDSIPVIRVMNKMDAEGFHLDVINNQTVPVSARDGTGLENLLGIVEETLSETLSPMRLFLPHPYGKTLSSLYQNGRVLHLLSKTRGVMVDVCLSEKWRKKYAEYVM